MDRMRERFQRHGCLLVISSVHEEITDVSGELYLGSMHGRKGWPGICVLRGPRVLLWLKEFTDRHDKDFTIPDSSATGNCHNLFEYFFAP